MVEQKEKKREKEYVVISRRDFLKFTGTVVIGVGIGGYSEAANLPPKLAMLKNGKAGIPVSEGYLLVDTKKCQGCMSCMLACSLVHEGKENLSLARIQVIQTPFERFPVDITLAQCRQCVDPACVKACPTGALHVDAKMGNVRRIHVEKCIGCQSCVEACPFKPSRAVWNFQKERAQKCDLCADTPFWNEQGGPGGKQACVEVCPVGAIKFTKDIPVQKGDLGYNVNLRGEGWKKLGYPTD